MTEAFVDTNVLLYVFSTHLKKAERMETLMRTGGVISVQVLNEFANVARNKFGASWEGVHEFLSGIRAAFRVNPVTVETHELGLRISERYGFKLYDSLLLAAALVADCAIFWSEDLQHGQLIDGRLTIRNPFI